MQSYTIGEALNKVKNNRDVKVKGKVITCLSIDHPLSTGSIGNKTRGLLDYLSRNGYEVIYTDGDGVDEDDIDE